MQLASCLTQWWTSQGETARGVSDIIIQSGGSYLNYNQERFLLASQCEDVPLSLAWGSVRLGPASSVDVCYCQHPEVGMSRKVVLMSKSFEIYLCWDPGLNFLGVGYCLWINYSNLGQNTLCPDEVTLTSHSFLTLHDRSLLLYLLYEWGN